MAEAVGRENAAAERNEWTRNFLFFNGAASAPSDGLCGTKFELVSDGLSETEGV
jgi:hypothetical protein